MKKLKFNSKLQLMKSTVSKLDKSEQNQIQGGDIEYTDYGPYTGSTCNVCSDPPNYCDTEADCASVVRCYFSKDIC